MISIGTFLGGVWANESWGRYWGWDAKEVGALVAWLTYAGFLTLGENKTAGMTARRMRNDEDVFECVISATRMMSADVTAFAAVCDRICAAQTARNARFLRRPTCTASWTSANCRA